MQYKTLGRTGIQVSEICLGTMTWGTQNSEAEAHEQMDYALDQGINFLDTAELYPVTPAGPETYGLTEVHIGTWMQARSNRDKVVLATKVAGPGRPYIRGGSPASPETMREALDASLRRLQTDLCRSLPDALAKPRPLRLSQCLDLRSIPAGQAGRAGGASGHPGNAR